MARLKRWACVLVAIFLIGVGATSAGATTIGIPSRAAWTALTPGLTNIDFNGIAAPGSFVSFGAGPLVRSGVSITSNASMFVIDPAFYGHPYSGGGFLNSDFGPSGVNILTFALPGLVTSVGFDLGGLFGPATPFSITLSNGDAFNSVVNPTSTFGGSLGFIGFVSTVPFSSLTISMGDAPNYNAIDNFGFGPTATGVVPEPATLTLLGLGLVALGRRQRRRRS